MTKVEQLIEILKDKDNCNVLDYIDDAVDMIEYLSKELEIAQDLAERRLNRKNMYKERSEMSLEQSIWYRLELKRTKKELEEVKKELEQVKQERDAMVKKLAKNINPDSYKYEWRAYW